MKTVSTLAVLVALAMTTAASANTPNEKRQNWFYYFGGPVAAAPCNPCATPCAPVCPPAPCAPVCPPPCPCPCPEIRGIFW